MHISKGSISIFPAAELLALGLDTRSQVVVCWMLHYANTLGDCIPSHARLARDAGIAAPTLTTVLEELKRIGVLYVERDDDGDAVRYVVKLGEYIAVSERQQKQKEQKPKVQFSPLGFMALYQNRYGTECNPERSVKYWQKVVAKFGQEKAEKAFGLYLKETEVKFYSAPRYAEMAAHYVSLLGGEESRWF